MNLYFNTKLVSSTIHENSESTFYPVVMPKDYDFDKQVLPFKILKSVLISYSKLKFKRCVFNIETDDEEYNKEIKDLLNKNFKNTELKINFIRPYNKKTWLDDIENNFGNNLDECSLIVMNHDHKFIDYQNQTFTSVVNKIFPKNKDNFKKILYYSHIPELISMVINKKYIQNQRFTSLDTSCYEIKYLNHQIDSFSLMTPRTLKYIISNIKNEIPYFGRLDWKGLFFKKLNIHALFYAREFFRHFEGYSHISGLRITEELSLNDSKLDYTEYDIDSKTRFYFNVWKRFSVFILKDGLYKNNSRKNYIKLIEKSLKIFTSTYLKEDLKFNLISKSEFNLIDQNLRNLIYYNANDIYSKIQIDNKLSNHSIFDKILDYYNSRFRYFKIIVYLKIFLNK